MEEKILELLLDIQARLGRLEEKVDSLERSDERNWYDFGKTR